jgi:hypothetical protein
MVAVAEAIGWLFLAATAGSMVWVYLDAPKHGLSRGWVIALFFFWIFTFPAYLVARSMKKRAAADPARARLDHAQQHAVPTRAAQGGAQPAWLPDPWFPGRFRYWDGERWTSNSADRPK